MLLQRVTEHYRRRMEIIKLKKWLLAHGCTEQQIAGCTQRILSQTGKSGTKQQKQALISLMAIKHPEELCFGDCYDIYECDSEIEDGPGQKQLLFQLHENLFHLVSILEFSIPCISLVAHSLMLLLSLDHTSCS